MYFLLVEGVSGPNVGDMFIWMPKEPLYVLVYLVTVMHSMQAGYMDKAQKYTDKALMQIEKLKSKYDKNYVKRKEMERHLPGCYS